jgi:hypothetical protein
VLIDARRRGLPDFLAGTVVLYANRELPPVADQVAVPAPSRGRGVGSPG